MGRFEACSGDSQPAYEELSWPRGVRAGTPEPMPRWLDAMFPTMAGLERQTREDALSWSDAQLEAILRAMLDRLGAAMDAGARAEITAVLAGARAPAAPRWSSALREAVRRSGYLVRRAPGRAPAHR